MFLLSDEAQLALFEWIGVYKESVYVEIEGNLVNNTVNRLHLLDNV